MWNLLKSFNTRAFWLEFWEERGERINDLSPLSWQFFEISWPLCCFQRLRVLKLILVSRKLQYSIWYHEIFVFSESCLSPKTFLIAENWLCFRACNSRIITYDQEFCHVEWFLCVYHCCENLLLWKVFFKKTLSWCCRKHVFVFEIVSLRGLNKFDQIIFFPWLLGKRFRLPLWKKFENFSILGVDFLFVLES